MCDEYGRPFNFIIAKWKGAVGAGSVRRCSVDSEVQVTLSASTSNTRVFSLSRAGNWPLLGPVRSGAKKEALLMCFSRAQIVPRTRISNYSCTRTLFKMTARHFGPLDQLFDCGSLSSWLIVKPYGAFSALDSRLQCTFQLGMCKTV